jgi:hypothetical protein
MITRSMSRRWRSRSRRRDRWHRGRHDRRVGGDAGVAGRANSSWPPSPFRARRMACSRAPEPRTRMRTRPAYRAAGDALAWVPWPAGSRPPTGGQRSPRSPRPARPVRRVPTCRAPRRRRPCATSCSCSSRRLPAARSKCACAVRRVQVIEGPRHARYAAERRRDGCRTWIDLATGARVGGCRGIRTHPRVGHPGDLSALRCPSGPDRPAASPVGPPAVGQWEHERTRREHAVHRIETARVRRSPRYAIFCVAGAASASWPPSSSRSPSTAPPRRARRRRHVLDVAGLRLPLPRLHPSARRRRRGRPGPRPQPRAPYARSAHRPRAGRTDPPPCAAASARRVRRCRR